MGNVVYLLNNDHAGHTFRFVMTPRNANAKLTTLEDGGVRMPKGSRLVKLICLKCNVVLTEGEDYVVGQKPPYAAAGMDEDEEDVKGSWKDRHIALYPDSLVNDRKWLNEHRRLYPETYDNNWLKEHKRLYGND